jgi:hypothetical protein
LQSTLLHMEHTRAVARDAERNAEARRHRVTHPPPPRRARRRAAELLARVAWRLDREAALRVWP